MASQQSRVSHLADELRGSAILSIAGEVRALIAEGKPILNLTVGDFSSKQFRIPKELEDGIVEAGFFDSKIVLMMSLGDGASFP